MRFISYNSLIQSLGWKIHLLLRENKTRNIILKNDEYIKKIIKGKLFNKEELEEGDNIRINLRNILGVDEYKNIIYSIIKMFSKELNSKINAYKTNLDNCKQYCLDLNFVGNDLERYIQKLKVSFKDIITIIYYYEKIKSIF